MRKNGTTPYDTNEAIHIRIDKLLEKSAVEKTFAGMGHKRSVTREQANINEVERLQKIWELDSEFSESKLYFKPKQ